VTLEAKYLLIGDSRMEILSSLRLLWEVVPFSMVWDILRHYILTSLLPTDDKSFVGHG
jgi:hypothetical protein